jgi:L-alanine-DL-glutamate epimerase-like enolase superfamily enzyme
VTRAGDDPVVEAVEVRTYTVPTSSPEADGTLAWDDTTMVLVRARAADATGTGWTYGPPACAAVVSDTLADVVRGRDVWSVTRTHEAMVDAVRNMGRPGIASMAISAVDTALWDLKARVLDVPVHDLLGRVHDAVAIYGSGGFTSYDDRQTSAQLTGWLDSGIPRVKIKVGEGRGSREDRDVARIGLARSVVGDGAELFVDANGAYDVGRAIRVARRVEEAGVSWFEEPVTSDDLDGLRRVRDHVTADVTAGEYGYDLTYFERMCSAQAVDCLQVDVTRCGGYTEWARAAAVARAHHLPVSAHCAPSLHLPAAAATRHLRHIEWFHDHVRIESMFFDGFPDPGGGRVTPSAGPGHGLVLREPDAEPYRVA